MIIKSGNVKKISENGAEGGKGILHLDALHDVIPAAKNVRLFSIATLEPGADVGYAIELIDGLRIFVRLWHGDEEFLPKLDCLWDENVLRYIRYETTWFALGLLIERIRAEMKV